MESGSLAPPPIDVDLFFFPRFFEFMIFTDVFLLIVSLAYYDRYFQWAARCDLEVLAATRGHLELYRASMEAAGLAASTNHCRPNSSSVGHTPAFIGRSPHGPARPNGHARASSRNTASSESISTPVGSNTSVAP